MGNHIDDSVKEDAIIKIIDILGSKGFNYSEARMVLQETMNDLQYHSVVITSNKKDTN